VALLGGQPDFVHTSTCTTTGKSATRSRGLGRAGRQGEA
jgi:hypothetical protein